MKFYLKEIGVSFLLDEGISSTSAKEFIRQLIKLLNMNLVFMEDVFLPPGFEIIVCIKQSHIIFSYWREFNYVRLIVSSCKNFNYKKVLRLIKKYFEVKKINCEIVKDKSLKREIKELWLK